MKGVNKIVVETISNATNVNGYATTIKGSEHYFIDISGTERSAAKVYSNRGAYFYVKSESKGNIENDMFETTMNIVLVNPICALKFIRNLYQMEIATCDDLQVTKIKCVSYDSNSENIIKKENGFIPLTKIDITEIKLEVRWNYITDCSC